MSAVARAQGCLLGQLVGDALGSQVEFLGPAEISRRYPEGVRNLEDGGTWNTIAGQPTDDSEMALALVRQLLAHGAYEATLAFAAYQDWLASEPFDCGGSIRSALLGRPNYDSQANGALMRASPLGIFGATQPKHLVVEWAAADAALTHPHPVCLDANRIYVTSLSIAIEGAKPQEVYDTARSWCSEWDVQASVAGALREAATSPPADYTSQQGWVLIALQNVFYQLLHAPTAEEAIIDTVMRGGDTDTNAAIAGAMVGAVYGIGSLPTRWVDTVLECKPERGAPRVHRPRPWEFWPTDALDLAWGLLTAPKGGRRVRPERFTADPDHIYVFRQGICIWPEWVAGRTEEEVKALTPDELVALRVRVLK
jgi:ADP-ribosylglycohydrolase